jgi:hypothetical protein
VLATAAEYPPSFVAAAAPVTSAFHPGKVGDAMAASGLPRCPCCVQRAEHVLATARRRIAAALAAVGLAAMAVLCWSGGQPAASAAVLAGRPSGERAGDRIILIAVAAVAAGAFILLQLAARSHRRRRPAFADWRTWPPGHDPWADRGDPARRETTRHV